MQARKNIGNPIYGRGFARRDYPANPRQVMLSTVHFKKKGVGRETSGWIEEVVYP
jgi:hypothetical protein